MNDITMKHHNQTIHDLFLEQALRTPDAAAVVLPASSSRSSRHVLSYRDLDRRANQLAQYLRQKGVGPDVMVGLCADPSIEMAVGMLGILKAGGAYLPLAPNAPAARLEYMLANAQPHLVLMASTDPWSNGHAPLRTSDRRPMIVDLVAEWPAIAREATDNPLVDLSPEHLAYVIYTSGSTGAPKGIQVPHRALINHCDAIVRAYGLAPTDRVLQFAALSFDVAAEEIFPTWASGAAVVLRPHATALAFADLVHLATHERLTVLNLPTAYWYAWVEDQLRTGGVLPSSLRLVVVGTEQAHAASLAAWLAIAGDRARCINAYGLTETTITATLYAVEASVAPTCGSVPIGKPIANTSAHVLDERLRPVASGAIGELYLGGAGLARGYVNQPELTAERFIPSPFDDGPGTRLYRTGDLARVLPDGNIEFVGRADQQLKIRGFRVEPGEVEHALRSQPAVREALVVPYEAGANERRLAAYIVQGGAGHVSSMSEQAAQVEQWRAVYDELYEAPSADTDSTFNIVGWNSSYTGEPIPAEEMHEWVDRTVERILALHPRRVLEIGCGTGLLLFRIAPHCERYLATDLSPAAIRQLRGELARHRLPHVALTERAADDLDGIEEGAFDLVIINSVTQHFPNAEYLVRVLEGALRVAAKGGRIFVGDVRSLPLLESFHTSVQLQRANESLPLVTLRQQVRRRMLREEELVIDPALFTSLTQHLPRIGAIDVGIKRGRFWNEMVRFRYDVLIHADVDAPAPPVEWLDWQDNLLTLDMVRTMLAREVASIGIRGVPNARLQADTRAVALLTGGDDPTTAGALREAARRTTPGVDPEELWTIGEDFGYAANITWAAEPAAGRLEVVFRKCSASAKHIRWACQAQEQGSELIWRAYTNDPTRAKFARVLAPELRRYLVERLPDYMIPAAFVPLDRLPRTLSGKVDRHALPLPEQADEAAGADLEQVEPRTPVEARLTTLWQELLGVRAIGVHENFFSIGGHSLLAMQLVSRIRDAFGVELPLRRLFETRDTATIARLAEYVEAMRLVRNGAGGEREQGEL